MRPGRSSDEISIVPLQQRFQEMRERGEITASEVARRMEWHRPDSMRVMRQLGLTGSSTKTSLTPQRAKELCDVIGIDYSEAGL